MNYIDYILLLPVVYGLYRGFSKGLILELASLIALLAGIYGAIHFSSFTFDWISQYVEVETSYLQLAAYGLTFLLIVLVITLTGKILTLLVKMVALGLVNRIMGALFGGIKALLILAVLLMFFDKFNKQFGLVDKSTLKSSTLYFPVLENTESFYPDILEELEKQKENIEEITDEL